MTMVLEPVVKELTVPVGPAAAFRRFTEEIDRWWPRASHSVFGDRCVEVRMEEGGWHPGRARESYDGGWDVLLAGYGGTPAEVPGR